MEENAKKTYWPLIKQKKKSRLIKKTDVIAQRVSAKYLIRYVSYKCYTLSTHSAYVVEDCLEQAACIRHFHYVKSAQNIYWKEKLVVVHNDTDQYLYTVTICIMLITQ